MHTTNSLIDGMLLGTLFTNESIEGLLDIVHQRLIVEVLITLAIQILKRLELLNITHTHIRGQIKVKSRDSLTSVHLVLATLHRDASQNGSRLNTFSSTRGTMTCNETACEDMIQRMLHTSKRLRWVIVLIVDVQIVMFYSITALLRK